MRALSFVLVALGFASVSAAQTTPATPPSLTSTGKIQIGFEGRGDYTKNLKKDTPTDTAKPSTPASANTGDIAAFEEALKRSPAAAAIANPQKPATTAPTPTAAPAPATAETAPAKPSALRSDSGLRSDSSKAKTAATVKTDATAAPVAQKPAEKKSATGTSADNSSMKFVGGKLVTQ